MEKMNSFKKKIEEIFLKLKPYLTREHILGILIAMLLVVALLAGIIIWIFSIGGEVIETPNLIGLDTLSALEVMTPYGLGLKIEGQVYNNKYPKGYIVQQDPEYGEKIRKNRDLKVIISKGTEMVSIPNLIGIPTRQAKVVLQQAGLIKGDEAQINSSVFPMNRIIAHTPAPGTLVKRGIKINMLVSLGPPRNVFMMPDCVGNTISQIEKNLNESGLLVNEVKYEYDPKLPDGTIISQNPVFAMPVKEGDNIKFKVTRREVFSDKNKLTKYAVLYYIPPIGILKKNVKIIIEDLKDTSREEVFSDQKTEPGQKIQLVVPIGEKSRARIYLDDELIEEKNF